MSGCPILGLCRGSQMLNAGGSQRESAWSSGILVPFCFFLLFGLIKSFKGYSSLKFDCKSEKCILFDELSQNDPQGCKRMSSCFWKVKMDPTKITRPLTDAKSRQNRPQPNNLNTRAFTTAAHQPIWPLPFFSRSFVGAPCMEICKQRQGRPLNICSPMDLPTTGRGCCVWEMFVGVIICCSVCCVVCVSLFNIVSLAFRCCCGFSLVGKASFIV